MSIRLDHANLTTRDLEATLRFLRTAFPEFRIRGRGPAMDGGEWVHVGNDDTYLALHQASRAPAEPWVPYEGRPGLNHLGFEVDDVEAVRARLSAAGYQDSSVSNDHPHRKRVYFRDSEGNDWEFVQYFSNRPAERHDYTL